jgi:16S rRNA (guanine966-N2)-methyltransferase
VREGLFGALGGLDGERVLDLFAGSGSLGIEALSRGAAHAVFVERSRSAAQVLLRNLGELELGPDRAEVRRTDVWSALRTAHRRGELYDLVFVDPPYRLAAGFAPRLAQELPAVIVPGGRVVSETDHRNQLDLGLQVASLRRYGDTLIMIHLR